jgi:hypothetical protein
VARFALPRIEIAHAAVFSCKLPLLEAEIDCSLQSNSRYTSFRSALLLPDCFQQTALSARFALTYRLVVDQHRTNEFKEK